MRTRAFSLLAALALAPAALQAQGGGISLNPYAGVAIGRVTVPDDLADCFGDDRAAGELRLGVSAGVVALEARASAAAAVAEPICAVADLFVPESGVHPTTVYPFERTDHHVGLDLRLRAGGTRALPFSVSAGAGYTPTYDLPYLLAAAGVRTGGRLRGTLEVEHQWFRVTRAIVQQEWQNFQVVREVSREERTRWAGGVGVRVGLELSAR